MTNSVTHLYATALFLTGLIGLMMHRHHLLMFLMCIELMLLGVNTNFIAAANIRGDTDGQLMVFFILTVAAAEVAIGLALLVILFRKKNSINIQSITDLRG
jgi:NADH-quinone oxidoreductase subunit K